MLARLNDRINQRHREGGFTLIELLVVIIIIGILLAIAVPSYMSFRDRANKSAAQANVRAAIPGVEAYYADNNTYANMTVPLLQNSYDKGIRDISVVTATSTTYCIQASKGAETWNKAGPAEPIATGTC
jgi:type IV pilus assembly protein PilA